MASTNVGSIHYDLTLDKHKFDSGVSSVNERLGNLASNAFDVAKKISIAFTAAAGATVAFGVKSSAAYEQSRVSLETLTGDVNKAKDLLQKLSKFAAETPFELPQLVKATNTLLSYGVKTEDVMDRLKRLGDAAAAAGGDLNGVTLAYAQMVGRGKVTGDNLRQMTENMVTLRDELSKVSGVALKDFDKAVENGEISIEELNKALDMATSEGGKFNNGMLKQSKTLSGLASTIKDNVGIELRKLIGISEDGTVTVGSLFDKLRIGAEWLVKNMPAIIETVKTKFQELYEKIKPVAIAVFEELYPGFKNLYDVIVKELAPAVGELIRQVGPTIGAGLVGAIKLATNVLAALFKFIAENKWLILVLAEAFVAVKVAMFLQGALAAFQTVMAGVRAAAALTAGAQGLGQLVTAHGTITALFATPFVPIFATAAALTALGGLVAASINASNTIKQVMNESQQRIDTVKRTAEEAVKAYKAAPTQEALDAKNRAIVDLYKTQREEDGLYNLGRASGGPVMSGRAYTVGEQGPEMFVPKVNGTIIPADDTAKLASGNGITNQIYGDIIINNKSDADYFLSQLMRDDLTTNNGLTPRSAIYGTRL